MNKITDKQRVSVQEMKEYYAQNYPFEPNNRRVGRLAKQLGFKLVKQMINRNYEYFYIKANQD